MGLRIVKVLGIQTFNLALLSDYTISSAVRWSHHQQRTLSQSNWMDILMYSFMEDVCIYWQDLKVFCQFAVEVFTLIPTRSTDQDDICFGISSAAFCHWSHLECIRTAILDAQGSTIASRMCQSDPKCIGPRWAWEYLRYSAFRSSIWLCCPITPLALLSDGCHHQQRTLSQSNWMDILMYSLMEDVCIYWQDLKVFCQFAVEVFTLIHTRSTDQDDICFGIASAAFCHWSHLECICTAILDAQGSTIAIKSNVPKWSKVHWPKTGLRIVKVLGIQTFNLALLSDYTISSAVRWLSPSAADLVAEQLDGHLDV